MTRSLRLTLALGLYLLPVALLWLHGPVVLPAGYHAFADSRVHWGLPNAADVMSNLGFLLVGLWGLRVATRLPASPGRPGWLLFVAGVMAVALGSAWYHLAPDDGRIVWDRLPIALACAGLSAAVLTERLQIERARAHALGLALVAWAAWGALRVTDASGDLRPYIALQLVPLLGVPALLWATGAARREQALFGAAAVGYVLAKLVEHLDGAIFALLGTLSGHTLKHVLATLSCALVVGALAGRPREQRVGAAGRAIVAAGYGCAMVGVALLLNALR